MDVRTFILGIIAFATFAYAYGPPTSLEMNVTTSQQGITVYTEAYTSDTAPNDTDICTTDTDCVIRHPEIIPDANTIDDYLRVYGDSPHFPTIGDCAMVDWLSQDEDGRPFVPIDLNNDGAIDCDSDLELGA